MIKTPRTAITNQGTGKRISNSTLKSRPSQETARPLTLNQIPPDPVNSRLSKYRHSGPLKADFPIKVEIPLAIKSKKVPELAEKRGQRAFGQLSTNNNSFPSNNSKKDFDDKKKDVKDLNRISLKCSKESKAHSPHIEAEQTKGFNNSSSLYMRALKLNDKKSCVVANGHEAKEFCRSFDSLNAHSVSIPISKRGNRDEEKLAKSSVMLGKTISGNNRPNRSVNREQVTKKSESVQNKAANSKKKTEIHEIKDHRDILPIKAHNPQKKTASKALTKVLSNTKSSNSNTRTDQSFALHDFQDRFRADIKAEVPKAKPNSKKLMAIVATDGINVNTSENTHASRIKTNSRPNPFSFKNFTPVERVDILSNLMSVTPSISKNQNPLLPIFQSTTSALKYRSEKRELLVKETPDSQKVSLNPRKNVTILTPSEIDQFLSQNKVSEYGSQTHKSRTKHAYQSELRHHQLGPLNKLAEVSDFGPACSKADRVNFFSNDSLSTRNGKKGIDKFSNFDFPADKKPKNKALLEGKVKTPLKTDQLKKGIVFKSENRLKEGENSQIAEDTTPNKRRMISITGSNWQKSIIFPTIENLNQPNSKTHFDTDSKNAIKVPNFKNGTKKMGNNNNSRENDRDRNSHRQNDGSKKLAPQYQSHNLVDKDLGARNRSSSPSDSKNYYSKEFTLATTMMAIKASPKLIYDDSDIVGWILNRSSGLPTIPKAKVQQVLDSAVKLFSYNTHAGICRLSNEDRVSLTISDQHSGPISPSENTGTSKSPCLFSIFDGHGGELCSQYLADNLHRQILTQVSFDSPTLSQDLQRVYTTFDKQFLKSCAHSRSMYSGSCALTVCLFNGALYTINMGDSRCIMSANEGNEIVELTRDHKPGSPTELERILASGGKITRSVWDSVQRSFSEETVTQSSHLTQFESNAGKKDTHEYGPWRMVPGGLSVSRAFGDFEIKSILSQEAHKNFICEPEVQRFELSNTDFIVIGCFLIR